MGLLQYPASGSATGKRQLFTSSGTFILPSGYGASNPLWARVTAVGGGGGGGQGYASAGGGGGAVVVKDIAITGNLNVIVGAGGSSGAESSNGGRGADTVVGNAPSRPTNLLRNPFQVNLYGGWDTTGWTTSSTGSMNVFRSDYSSSLNQYLRNRHFICTDADNYGGVFKSSYGITVYSSSGTGTYTFYSDFFPTDAAKLHYYGVYTRSGQGGNPTTVTIEWYDDSNTQLGTLAQLSTFTFTYDSSDNKFAATATSPTGTTKARLKIVMTCGGTNYFQQLFGAFVSQEVNCAWMYSQNAGSYWTGAYYTSYLTRLTTTGISTSTALTQSSAGIVAGGGGGGGRAGDEGTGGWLQARFGGPGGHQGGYGASYGEDSNGSSFIFGGDGGGAGGQPYREVFRGNNGTTPYSNDSGFVGLNHSGSWRTFGYRMPVNSHFQRPSSGNSGTSGIYLNGISSSQFAQFRIEGSKPHYTGYASGGPGRGYANFTETEANVRYFYNAGISHYRELPFGNGGAATNGLQNRNTTNYGDIDYYVYGDWPTNGDPGIVVFEFMS